MIKDNSVSLSSRALQQLLAGEMTLERFLDSHSWDRAASSGNPFRRALRSGRMIAKIEVQPENGRDDDWLTFKFGNPDTAIAPFVVPNPHVQTR